MKLRPLIKQSIRAYYDGTLPEETIKSSENPFIYTMEFFDELMEQDLEEVGEDDDQSIEEG
jgi:hypothetical protein